MYVFKFNLNETTDIMRQFKYIYRSSRLYVLKIPYIEICFK